MSVLPRRGPVSPEQRLKDNLRTQANGSAYGQTPNARPVRQDGSQSRQAPSTPPGFGLDTVYAYSASIPLTAGAGDGSIAGWTAYTSAGAVIGNSIHVGTVDDDPSRIFMDVEGVYAAQITMFPGIGTELIGTSSDCTIVAEANSGIFFDTPRVDWHGTETRSGFTSFASSGAMLAVRLAAASSASASIGVDFYWHDLPVDSELFVDIGVFRIR